MEHLQQVRLAVATPQIEEGWATQVTDSFIDGFQHAPRVHPSESAARAYARDIFRRRKCDVKLLNPAGIIVEDHRFLG